MFISDFEKLKKIRTIVEQMCEEDHCEDDSEKCITCGVFHIRKLLGSVKSIQRDSATA